MPSTTAAALTSGPNIAALATLPGIGPARAVRLATVFETWEAFLTAGTDDLIDALGSSPGIALAAQMPHEPLTATIPDGTRAISRFDPDFPPRLLTIPDPPPLLFVTGTVPPQGLSVAIVGTRHPDDYAIRAARLVATQAAERGIVNVSGFAIGVDSHGHEAALDAGAPTWAFLGQGINTLTPDDGPRHSLAQRVVATGGGLLSEVAPDTSTTAAALVRRNRLQSGLTYATVIAQSGLASGRKPAGTMHTARYAIEQRRHLVVVAPPAHHATDPASAGNQALTSPDPIDPRALQVTSVALRDYVATRAPAADRVLRHPDDLDGLWDYLAGLERADTDRDPTPAT